MENIPIINKNNGGHWVQYRDHYNKIIKRVFEPYNNNMAKIELQSKYVKAGVDIKEGDVCVIRSEGIKVETPNDKSKKRWQFEIELMSGTIKTISPNNSSLVNLIKLWGDEMSEWIGQSMSATIVKVNTPNGIKDSIIWSPVGFKKQEPEEVK